MSKTKYTFETFADFTAVVEVDADHLTVEVATEINQFWGGASERLRLQRGDIVQTVARLFASRCLFRLLADGTDTANGAVAGHYQSHVLGSEGWPGAEFLGLRLVGADVALPGYDELELVTA